jgi:hypothetical protein
LTCKPLFFAAAGLPLPLLRGCNALFKITAVKLLNPFILLSGYGLSILFTAHFSTMASAPIQVLARANQFVMLYLDVEQRECHTGLRMSPELTKHKGIERP